jgi:acetyltransferase-like isoleucine patch superfamily enzyme
MSSITYRFLKRLGLNYSEAAYGNVSLLEVFNKTFTTLRNSILLKYFMNSALLEPISPRKLRPALLRFIGCKVGKNVFIGQHVTIDAGYADLIMLEENVHVAGHTIFLCHQRDLSNYSIGDDYSRLGYRIGKIHLMKGCLIGTNTLILPGVTVGEGAIVGAGSLIAKDIPAWCMAFGRPAKVVRYFSERVIN